MPHFLDSERPFSSSHFNVSEIGMCLKSLYEFSTAGLPSSPSWKVAIKLTVCFKSEEMWRF